MSNNIKKTITHQHTTTVDRAKLSKTAIFRAGQKRTFEDSQLSSHPESVKKDHVEVSTFPFPATSNRDFHRPSSILEKGFPPLVAGEIQSFQTRPSTSEFSQRRSLALTPSATLDPRLDLSHPSYNLPTELVRNLAGLGIKSIYPWQKECLLGSGVLEGHKNLVYTAPTGGGKSLVADVLMLKKVIDNPGEKAILVLPYVALVQEKLRWIRKVVHGIKKKNSDPTQQRPSNFCNRGDEHTVRVAGFFGGSQARAAWADLDIAICTIEKANSFINASIEDASIGQVGIVVMDEIHMIHDESRGYILELMATKLLSIGSEVQLIGMSATLNNASVLATWLDNAKFYISRYRPVPVEEHLVFDNAIYSTSSSKQFFKTATQLSANATSTGPSQLKTDLSPIKMIQQSPNKELSNPVANAVVSLAYETVRSGYGALVFCSSRSGCERDAILISRVLPLPETNDVLAIEKRIDLLNDLRNSITGLDSTLEKTVPVGVAFHHAGLTTEERDLLATAYDNGVLKVIVATCSLAAGINLPARRVILHGARMGADLVGPAMLRQMRGRAGRKGKDEIGETFLCCEKSDLEAVSALIEAEIPNVESCLLPEKRGIKRALLEVIVTKLATSNEGVNDYLTRTLLYHSMERDKLFAMVNATMDELKEDKLVTRCPDGDYAATLIGQAIVVSSLTPEDGIFVHGELQKALQAFVMDGELHALYAFTPVQANNQASINWQVFRKEIERLDESNMRALSFIGLKPSVINRMAQGGKMKESSHEEILTVRIYQRFYVALQLRDLCNEMPIHAVAAKYDIPRGVVQTLAQTCHGFASGMIKFCNCMDWGALSAVLNHFSDRLKAGAKSDLLALAKITFVKSRTARVFWENGLKTVAMVAAADVKDIVPVLLQAQPKKLKTSMYDENSFMEKLVGKARVISESANRIWEQQIQLELQDLDD